MLKRWAARPQSIKWLTGVAAVLLGLAIAWALFVPIADWLAHHDVGSVKGSLHETAVDNARSRLLTLGAGLAAAGALVFTARNFTLGRRTFELTEQGQVTDRYTKAVEQLGSNKLDVRIGGIYALERVARDSARDHPTVMQVLTAFIREHSHEALVPPDPRGPEEEPSIGPDVQAAVAVVGNRDAERDIQPINLARAYLGGADLAGSVLVRVNLFQAHLNEADLSRADLSGAFLQAAHLVSAELWRANLSGADLSAADLSGANLSGANLSGADLNTATLTRARLIRADLSGADLDVDNLSGAEFSGAELSGALWAPRAEVPAGWQRDADSGRLSRAGTNSDGTAAK